MANTRITQGVIKPNENYLAGIITAQNINVTGVLTYEDVTNVDSIGVITARKGIVSSGVVTATAFHGDGSQLTGIDATALKDSGGNVKIQAQASGAVHTGFSTMQNLRVTGIATFGSGSTTIDNNVINVGTALTLGHTQGLQFHTQNLHADGFEINNINASGIITAAQFSGDGSNLANLPAGLGTALSSTQSSPLNKIYYTNTVLPVESTVTVDTPASASAAYTQYADISVGTGADLIISDGDDLIPDVLGLRPDGTFGGGALGRMRVDKIVGKDANSAVNFEKGIVVTGVVTATSFSGDGSALTGITQTTINNNADNRLITGSGSANTLNAETNLTYNGTKLTLTGNSASPVVEFINTSGAQNEGDVLKLRASGRGSGIDDTDVFLITNNSDTRTFGISNAGTVNVTGDIKMSSGKNINSSGIITATSFSGDGSALTGTGVGGNTSVNTTGIITATAFVGDFQPRNMIINGAMQINARANGTLTINSSTGQYPCDRWVSRGEGGSKAFTIQKTSIASSGRGIRNSVKVTSSQAASVSDYDIFNFRQMIEGFNIQRLNLGEAGCASMALSFTVRSSVAGTHSGAIQNESQNRSYPFTYTLVANTWKDVKITIPPITSGSFNEGTGVGLILVFDMGSGNEFRGTANQWNSAQDEGATGAVRILETNGATWEISKVQLEEGTVCTPFEKRMVTQETILCERYYQRYGAQRHNWMTNVNGTDHRKMVYFSTTMRTSPTMNLYDQSVDGSSVSAQYASPNGYSCRLNGNGRHASWKHEATAEL